MFINDAVDHGVDENCDDILEMFVGGAHAGVFKDIMLEFLVCVIVLVLVRRCLRDGCDGE